VLRGIFYILGAFGGMGAIGWLLGLLKGHN